MSDDLRDNEKLYGDRDPFEQDQLGNYFIVHMHHLTTENLHSKAEIAEELAHRDIKIDRLEGALKQIPYGREALDNIAEIEKSESNDHIQEGE